MPINSSVSIIPDTALPFIFLPSSFMIMQFQSLKASETMFYLTLYFKIFEHRLNRLFSEIAKKGVWWLI